MVAVARIEVVVALEALSAEGFGLFMGLRLTNRRWIESAVLLSDSVVLVSLCRIKIIGPAESRPSWCTRQSHALKFLEQLF